MIGQGRLLADTSVAELSARSASLEEAFFELTSGSTEYRGALDSNGRTRMTTTAATGGRYRFAQVARMEWIKLRSLRSTWWVLTATVAGAIGIAVAVGVNTRDATADLTNNALAGISLGLLLIGVLGVLVMTGEYSSGMIRATLAAVPNRPLVLAAKAAVFGVVALAAGEAAGFIAFFAGTAALPGRDPGARRSASPACCGRSCWAGRASAWSG